MNCKMDYIKMLAEESKYKLEQKQTMKLKKQFVKDNADKTLKEVFPELFEVKLEVGKWYKCINNKAVCFVTKILSNSFFGYGICYQGKWTDYFEGQVGIHMRPATDQEVESALIAEAKKRGYKEGVFVISSQSQREMKICGKSIFYSVIDNLILADGICVLNKGQWAEIIPTMTQAEAEEKFNVKIV